MIAFFQLRRITVMRRQRARKAEPVRATRRVARNQINSSANQKGILFESAKLNG